MKQRIMIMIALLPLLALAQPAAQRIDSLVNSFTSDAQFNGSVVVAHQGKIILSKGYGFSNAEQQVANTPATVFNIASLTKAFTAAIILKLQEQKKLSVQDPLSKYDSSYPGGHRITLHHLLTHTSGIYNYTDDKDFQRMDQARAIGLQQMIAIFKNKPLQFEPGSRFQYSNSGYTLLGSVIEKVTGMTYGQVLEEMIFRPLGMKNSSYGPPANKHTATGYQMYFRNFKKPSYAVHPSVSYATGAIYSTAEDMYLWHRALQGNRFLSEASRTAAYKKDVGYYGYGWSTDSLYGRLRVSHSGSIAGYKSNINRFPDADLCIIALSNSNNAGVGELVRQIVNIVLDQPLAKTFFQQPVLHLPDTVLQRFTGTYRFGPQDTAGTVVRWTGKQLSLQVAEQPAFLIEPVTPNQFRSGNARIEFMKYNGRLQLMIFKEGEVAGMMRE